MYWLLKGDWGDCLLILEGIRECGLGRVVCVGVCGCGVGDGCVWIGVWKG